MTVTQVVFIILAALALAAGVGMVALRNLLHNALCMILALIAVAGIFVLLESGFLAVVQILVYVGAVATLILFGVMLTRGMAGQRVQAANTQWALAAALAACMLVAIGVVLVRASWPASSEAIQPDAVVALGKALVDPYALPFEAASVLLLVAMVGAIVISREAHG